MNRFVALLMAIALSPALLVIALIVKLESKGPAIFAQRRVGQFGKHFTMYKFRTMQSGMPDVASDQVGENDPRFTASGKWLRRFSVDEFPQLFNIIKGEMAFVGPRPALYNQYDLIAMRHERGIDELKPGITGWAQVNYPYGASVEDARNKLAYDLYYLRHRSLALDVSIIIGTIRVILLQEGAR